MAYHSRKNGQIQSPQSFGSIGRTLTHREVESTEAQAIYGRLYEAHAERVRVKRAGPSVPRRFSWEVGA